MLLSPNASIPLSNDQLLIQKHGITVSIDVLSRQKQGILAWIDWILAWIYGLRS
jgi:hypothetical protein